LSYVSKRPALFLDRDGVINLDKGYISRIENFSFVSGIFPVIRIAQNSNFRIVIITNQSGIGRGLINIDQYHKLTNWMLNEFARNSCLIDLVLTSSLDPNKKNVENFETFRRKPNPGMIYDAKELLNIDLVNSILIGDNISDIEAGLNAKIKNLFLINKKMRHPLVNSVTVVEDLLLNSNFLVSLEYGKNKKET